MVCYLEARCALEGPNVADEVAECVDVIPARAPGTVAPALVGRSTVCALDPRWICMATTKARPGPVTSRTEPSPAAWPIEPGAVL